MKTKICSLKNIFISKFYLKTIAWLSSSLFSPSSSFYFVFGSRFSIPCIFSLNERLSLYPFLFLLLSLMRHEKKSIETLKHHIICFYPLKKTRCFFFSFFFGTYHLVYIRLCKNFVFPYLSSI